jgi:hypothetical protein
MMYNKSMSKYVIISISMSISLGMTQPSVLELQLVKVPRHSQLLLNSTDLQTSSPTT